MNLHFLLKFSIFLLSIIIFSTAKAQENQNSKLDAFFKSQLDSYGLVAISAGIIKNNSLVWSGAFGYKDLEAKKTVDETTLFHQGSISKTITLAAFLHLCQEKEIDLKENINKYLPFEIKNPKHVSAPITFYMLLTHTSGINDVNISKRNNRMSSFNGFIDVPQKLGFTIKNILSKEGEHYSEDYFLDEKPGEKYAYSNIAYSLIGYLIEQISGESFIAYCQKNIFEPLDMNESTFLLSKTDTSNFAYQYSFDPDKSQKYTKVQPYTWAGYMDGSLRTNVTEYSNFLIMLMNKGIFGKRQVLSEKTVETMLQVQELPGKQSVRLFQPAGRAILWNKVKVPVNGKTIEVYHFNGFGSGFFTEAFFSVDAKIAGMFYTTGQFKSFPLMGRAVKESMIKMIESALD